VIFEPIDSTIRKAIVIPKVPHNHPSFLHVKPLYEEKEFIVKALEIAGQDKTPRDLRIGS
jgi:hypothetical protein